MTPHKYRVGDLLPLDGFDVPFGVYMPGFFQIFPVFRSLPYLDLSLAYAKSCLDRYLDTEDVGTTWHSLRKRSRKFGPPPVLTDAPGQDNLY